MLAGPCTELPYIDACRIELVVAVRLSHVRTARPSSADPVHRRRGTDRHLHGVQLRLRAHREPATDRDTCRHSADIAACSYTSPAAAAAAAGSTERTSSRAWIRKTAAVDDNSTTATTSTTDEPSQTRHTIAAVGGSRGEGLEGLQPPS